MIRSIKKILVISELSDYFKAIKKHYSFTKGFGISTGLSKLATTYYLTTGYSQVYQNVNFINIKEVTDIFIKEIDFILLIRELNILQIMERIPSVEKVLLNENRTQFIGIKSDSMGWIFSHSYLNPFQKKYNRNWLDFLVSTFSMICVQTKEYKIMGLSQIKRKRRKYHSKFEKIIFISRMGVFPEYPLKNNLEDPYTINHSYCCDDFNKLQIHKALHSRDKNVLSALHPLCYTKRNIGFTKDKGVKYNTKKTKIIYMGRIRTNQGKIALMMKDIMIGLGEDYELHIFPGRFNIPYSHVSVYSAKQPSNLQILRDTIFYQCKNVIIHYPFDDKFKGLFLQYADIGLDFSSVRPDNRICPAGNAKLLEYCNYGLKLVSEKNVNNSHLVTSGKNGILLEGLGTVDQYVDAIKKLRKMKYNREFTIKTTIDNHNWNIIAKELYQYVCSNQ